MHGRDGYTYKILAKNQECKLGHGWKDIIKRNLRYLWLEDDWI